MPARFMRDFPNLATARKTSDATTSYNCIAWACGDNSRWWWPDPDPTSLAFWPPGYQREETIAAFDAFFFGEGATVTTNQQPQENVAKIALFAKNNVPTHAARLLNNGTWSSKLGVEMDIAHTLDELEGGGYGDVVKIYAIQLKARPR